MSIHDRQVTYSSSPNHAARAAHARGRRKFAEYDVSGISEKHGKATLNQIKNSPHFSSGLSGSNGFNKKTNSSKNIAKVILVIVIVLFGVLIFRTCSAPKLLEANESAQITVAEGAGAKQVADQLYGAGLITDVGAFVGRVDALNATSSIKPGTYTFFGKTGIDDIIRMLVNGPVNTTVTIPEGYTLNRIASEVENATKGRVASADFISAASDASKYVADFPFLKDAGNNSLEGYLFPKTYEIDGDSTADSIIRTMLNQYQIETAALDYSIPSKNGLSAYQTLILASIIEKESTSSTREKVASVFYNRLTTTGEPSFGYLQSDATTAYEVGHDPTPNEVHANTPYSTYTHQGLPPTPICCPGIEAIRATCKPESTKYYYFYFTPDGKYFFSETLEEHNNVVQQHS